MNITHDLLARFEAAIRGRNPELANRLLPGLPEGRVRRMLNKGRIEGAVEPIVALFSWKNGTIPNAYITPEQPSLFPGAVYMLAEVDLMIAHFIGFKEIAVSHPQWMQAVQRYFPLFWNGSMDYLALDLKPASQNRIVTLENKGDIFVREAYTSLEDFLKDAIQANENNEPLACTRKPGKPITDASENCPASVASVVTSNEGISQNFFTAESALVLRTDFSDEPAWKSLCKSLQNPEEEFNPSLHFISDPEFDGLTVDKLPSLLSEDSSQTFAFIVDRTALTHSGNPVLVIDLHDKPGQMFRVSASALGDVANNLSVANMDFDDFAKAVDKDGVFRGFSGT